MSSRTDVNNGWLNQFSTKGPQLQPYTTQGEVLRILGTPKAKTNFEGASPASIDPKTRKRVVLPGRGTVWTYMANEMGGTDPVYFHYKVPTVGGFSFAKPGPVQIGGRYVKASHNLSFFFQGGRLWRMTYVESDMSGSTINSSVETFFDLYQTYSLEGYPSTFPPDAELR